MPEIIINLMEKKISWIKNILEPLIEKAVTMVMQLTIL